MTRSLLSTSFVLLALGSMTVACDGGTSGGTGGSGTEGGGTGGTSTTGGGGAGGTSTTGGTAGSTTTTGGTGGGTGGSTTTTGGAGGTGGGTGGAMGGSGGTGGSSTSSGMTTSTTDPLLADDDQDGWTVGDGDCCDSPFAGCSNKPELVNPGALEYPGNGVDDDCKASTLDTDPYPTCSTKAAADTDIANMSPISSLKLVKAMDLCVTTLENPPALKDKTWGVITSDITLADGTKVVVPKNIQLGVLPTFGPNVTPQYGETMAAISTGTARRENYGMGAADPGYVHPQNGPMAGQTGNFNAMTQCPAPPAYVAANGGQVPSPCGNCMGPTCIQAFDSVALRVKIRPPTNAKSFSYRFNFFSAEYPEFVCQDFNDFFVALIDGNTNAQIPADKNIAFDGMGNAISVNNAFFQVCFPQVGDPPGTCSGGTLQLVGNGMGGWNGSIFDGGGTGWLQNDVPMLLKQNPNNPGDPTDQIPVVETFDLQFIIWDAGDHNVDSLVLLDRFRWNLAAADLSTHQ